jgi:hypothetical protein
MPGAVVVRTLAETSGHARGWDMKLRFGCSTALFLVGAAALFMFILSLGRAHAVTQFPESYGLDLGVRQPLTPSNTGQLSSPKEAFDLDALRQARTFCVDLGHLDAREAVAVKTFIADSGGADRVIMQLPWQLANDCTRADVVARIYFRTATVTERRTDLQTGLKQSSEPEEWPQPVLVIYDKASIRLLYRAEGLARHRDFTKELAYCFSVLLKDLKTGAKKHESHHR